MTREKIFMTGFIATLAVAAFVQLDIQAGPETVPLHPPAPAGEVAKISYNFPGIPVEQFFSIYAVLAKEKLIIPASTGYRGTVRVMTNHPITRTEALQLLETTLAEQAQIIITRSTNGSLMAISKAMQGSPISTNRARTYLPDGKIDPPFSAVPGMVHARPGFTNSPP